MDNEGSGRKSTLIKCDENKWCIILWVFLYASLQHVPVYFWTNLFLSTSKIPCKQIKKKLHKIVKNDKLAEWNVNPVKTQVITTAKLRMFALLDHLCWIGATFHLSDGWQTSSNSVSLKLTKSPYYSTNPVSFFLKMHVWLLPPQNNSLVQWWVIIESLNINISLWLRLAGLPVTIQLYIHFTHI